jgi:hypothetical protein
VVSILSVGVLKVMVVGYPKCVPSSKASSMSAAAKKKAVARKRATNPSGGGKKPTYART